MPDPITISFGLINEIFENNRSSPGFIDINEPITIPNGIYINHNDGKESEDESEDESDKPKKSGYDQTLFLTPVEDYMMCAICYDVVRNPPNLKCPHLFCEGCLDGVVDNKCPSCREEITNTGSVSIIKQIIWNKEVKCEFNHLGCKWTDKIGTDDRNIIDHSKVCEFGQYTDCPVCKDKIIKGKLDNHVCPDEEVECEYCNIKLKRKLLLIHKSFGEYKGDWCENREKCIHECDKYIKTGEMKIHLETECPDNKIICYACDIVHMIPYYEFASHFKEKVKTPEDINRFFGRSNIDCGKVGSLVDCVINNEWVVCEIIELNIVNPQPNVSSMEHPFNVKLRVIETGFETWVYDHNICGLGKYTGKEVDINNFFPMEKDVKECLMNCRCTITLQPDNSDHIHVYQPFYNCITCSGSCGNIGCCSACMVVCHAGHDIELNTDSNHCYCDCGAKEMYDQHSEKVVKCRTNKKIYNDSSVNDSSVNDSSVNDSSVNDSSVNDSSVNDSSVVVNIGVVNQGGAVITIS